MTVTAIAQPGSSPATPTVITTDAVKLTIEHLVITHPEAVGLANSCLAKDGADALEDLLRRAVPIGLLACTVGSVGADTGAIQRTLDVFSAQVDQRSTLALDGLNITLERLRDGEVAVTRTAQQVLDQLPAQIQAALAGESAHVRAAVAEAAAAVQAAGISDVRNALAQHSESVRNALSLDHDGPVQSLRHDLLAQLDLTRKELAEQLTVVRGMLQANEAHKAGSTKSTRAIGQEFEIAGMGVCREVIEAAGDRYEDTGASPAPGGTGRAGDGLATLSSAITGNGRPVHIVLEAKLRTRPITARAWRDELSRSRNLRGAAGALGIVPTAADVPGGGPFTRVDDMCFVVAADDPAAVALIYRVLREIVALVAVRQSNRDDVDLARVEAQINLALSALKDFDETARLLKAAKETLDKVFNLSRSSKEKIHQALTDSLATMQA